MITTFASFGKITIFINEKYSCTVSDKYTMLTLGNHVSKNII